MAAEGAGVMQVVDLGEVRALAVWRTFLTTYCGRRFEIDDLVTVVGFCFWGFGVVLFCVLVFFVGAFLCFVVLLFFVFWTD